MSYFSSLLNFLLPPHCLLCEQIGSYFCNTCKKRLELHPPICPVCHKPSREFRRCLGCHGSLDQVLIMFTYSHAVQTIIKQFKYGHSSLLAEFLGSQLALHISTQDSWEKYKGKVVITSIPMHRYKQHRIRGYNQAKLLAKTCARELNVPYTDLLSKPRRTFSQASKNKQKREQTLQNAFTTKESDLTPKHILLIDDVMTTGTTLSQAARLLKQNYPKATIWGAVLARNG